MRRSILSLASAAIAFTASTAWSQTCTRPPCDPTSGRLCPQIIACPVDPGGPPPSDSSSCYFVYNSQTNGIPGVTPASTNPDALVYSIDTWLVGEYSGESQLIGISPQISSVVTSYTPEPYCTQVADQYALVGATSATDSQLYQGTYTIVLNGQSVATPFYAWDHTFFDNVNRGFAYSYYQYPFFFVSPYVVLGVDARDGSTFQVVGNALQIIDAEGYTVDDCSLDPAYCSGGGPV